MWAKNYLKTNKEHLQWAYFADEIMVINVPKSEEGVSLNLRINPLMQSWCTTTRKDGKGNPKFLQDMMGAIKRYNVRLEAITLTWEALQEMPICWKTHKKRPQKKGSMPIWGLQSNSTAHWMQGPVLPDDQNEDEVQEEEWQFFRPQTIMARSLQEAFRVFTEGDSYSLLPGVAPRVAGNILDGQQTVHVKTKVKKKAKAEVEVFYAEGNPRNSAIRVPSMMTQTNQVAEMLALHKAIRTNLSEDMLKIESDS
ncbi:hypothetical protein BDN71DRAFT_1435849 [Pleurotus eryngii]|uniref:Reverse transcriptase domain-containing protein n=1 Tax=Pleurotus eryngii TaxID=5323 RepID=A0A9P6D9M1_PLEER|nr:hypothetical protein BDN71DRAFT_1435849 [Pleurotus eryngii]